MHFDAEQRAVYLSRHGSHAYGTSTESSDLDVKGFCVSPKKFVLGYAYAFEQLQTTRKEEGKPDLDLVIYDIRKFVNLAADCNPNIIEVLFVADSDILKMTPAGQLIRDNRELFISKKARHTFSGYAISQLKRIRTHRGYLLNPPDHKPTREEFGLAIDMKITSDMMGALDKMNAEGMETHPNVMELVQQEKRYKSAMDLWNSHENWKATRNEARSELEAKFGYDTKHAQHLVRLLRMCREILEGKGVLVKRPDADELREIRAGAWSYDQLIEWAEREDAEMQELYKTSTIPHHPDVERLNDLCIRAQELHWSSENPA